MRSDAPGRKQNAGWFKRGQPGPRLTTGLYSDTHPAAAHIVAAVEQFTTAARIDDGGADLPARRASLIDYRGAIVHKNILKIALALEERGLFDKRGKLRIAWLSKLESLINTAVRIDGLLGLARHARRTQTPREWLAGLPDRQGGQDAHAHADEDHAADHDAEPADEGTVD